MTSSSSSRSSKESRYSSSFSTKGVEDDSDTDENEEETLMKFKREQKQEEDDYDEDEEDDDFEGDICDTPRRTDRLLNSAHFRNRRPSRANLFCKVGMSSPAPSRSLSFNSTRDKLKVQELRGGPPKSPRSKSPQPSHPNSPLTGGPSLHRRSIGPPDSKLVVLGVPCVGKSAIVVRLLTGRFIWEYDPTLEAVYRYHTTVDDDPATSEILDTAGLIDGSVNEGHVRWGDGFLIVYSLTDRSSFLAASEIHAAIAGLKHTPNFPCVLLANKSDLVHLSKVSEEEGSALASELGVSFFTASASEGSSALWEAFAELHRDVVRRMRSRRRRSSAKVVIEGFYKMFSR